MFIRLEVFVVPGISMGLLTWVAIGVIVLVAIGLGLGTFFSGLFMGVEKVAENPIVQNATDETIQAANELTDRDEFVAVDTQRTVYKQQEPVVIIVKNEGDQRVTISDSPPQVEVTNTDNAKSYDVVVTQVKTELEPGETVTITWDQRDNAGNNVESGTYSAVLKSDESTVIGQTTFTIES